MTSEIRANKQTNRAGLGTVTYADTGIIVSGIVTCTELSGLTALNIAGVGTASTLDINGDIDVDGHTNLDNVSIAGVTTMTGNLSMGETLTISGNNPNVTFTDTNSNPDYKIYGSNGAFTILDSTNGVNRFAISSTGNISISNDLDVDGHTNLDNVSIAGVTTVSNKVQVNSLGVGIVPDDHMHLHISSANPRILIKSTGTNASKIFFGDSSSNDPGVIEYEHTNNRMRFGTNNNEDRLVIDSSGFIKQSFTSNNSTVAEGLFINNMNNGTGTNASLIFSCDSGERKKASISYIDTGNYGTGDMAFCLDNDADSGTLHVTNHERMRITKDGSVNIGGDYTQTSRKFKVTGNSTFDGGVVFTGTLEGSGFSVSGGNVIMPAFIAHDGDSNTKFGFAAADRFTVETAGNERLRIDENGKIIVATGTLHSTRVLARFGIDCHGMNIYDNVGVVANYGMAFYNDPNTNYANGIGFFNDDGQTCGGYIVHQDKGSGNLGDIVMATSATSNNPVERLRITSTGHTVLARLNTFSNPNNTGSEVLGAKLVFGSNISLEERYPNGAYVDRQDLVLRANRGYGLGQFDNIRFTAGGTVNIENKTITGGNNLAIQNFVVKGIYSGSPSIGKSIELISGYDSAVKMAAIGYNLTDVNLGSTYGGDLTFHTQPLYSSPTTPLPERMRISSSGYITKSVVPSWNLRPSYNSNQTTSNTSSHHAIGWSADSSGGGSTSSKATFLQNCTLHGSGWTYNLHNGQNVSALRVPVAGRYYVNVTYRVENNPNQGNIYVYVNGSQIARQHVEMWAHRPYMHCQWASVLNLAKNDEIIISISCPNATVSGRNDNVNWFSGYLIG